MSHPSTPPSTNCIDQQLSTSPDSQSPPRSPDDSPSHMSHKTSHLKKESSHPNTSPFPTQEPNNSKATTSPPSPEWSPLTVNIQNERNHSTPKTPHTHYAYPLSPSQADFTSTQKPAQNRKEDHSLLNNEYGSTPNTDKKPWSSSQTDQKQIEQQAGPLRASMLARSYLNTTSHCHRHGRLCDYRSTLFFILLSPTLHLTLIDLIFLLILSIHMTLILSYPFIFTLTITHSLSFFQICWLFCGVITGTKKSQRLSTRTKEDGLPRPTRKRPGSQLTRRATPGSPPR